jgi:hypothetical protein
MHAPPAWREAAQRRGYGGGGDDDADALAPEEPAMPVQAGASLVEALPQAHFAALSKLLSEATDWLVLLQVRAAPPRRAAPTPRDAHLPPLRKPPFLSPRQYHAASAREPLLCRIAPACALRRGGAAAC